MVTRAAALCLCAMTTACGGSGSVVRDDVSGSYNLADLSAGASGRDFTTVVVGNPVGGSDAEFGSGVAAILNTGGYGVATNFTTTPGSTANPDYKVVLVFNPEPQIGSQQVCDESSFPTDPALRPITVRAAFCIQGNEATAASAWIPDARSPSDPTFVTTIQNLGQDLFPPAPLF